MNSLFRMLVLFPISIGVVFSKLILSTTRSGFIYLNTVVLLFLHFAIVPAIIQQENNAPVVKINAPKNNAVVEAGATVNYEIDVADKEDGNSKYDELNNKEILLEVKLVKDRSNPAMVAAASRALTIMRTSNCFNCHNFNSKSIGPSFYEISKRYPVTAANTDSLVKRIRMGSSEAWGKEKMPAHPELTREEIKATASWILKHAADPGIDYYIGATGTFRIKKTGMYRLTATYLDHGQKNAPGKQRLQGHDVIYINNK